MRQITDRRDVAFTAMACITLIAVFGGISTLMRPNVDDEVRVLSIIFALAATIAAGAITMLVDTPALVRLRHQATYSVIGAIIIAGLTYLSDSDAGISTPFFVEIVLIAAYLGLVLSTVWGRVPIVLILGVCWFLIARHPESELIDKVSLPLIAVAAWLLGRLGHLTHGKTARKAIVLSRSDALTGMLNRRGFFEELDYTLDRAAARRRPVSLLLIDLDGFKAVNDRYGHAAGDGILHSVGEQLAAQLPAGASAGRLGGDEFAVMLPGASSRAARAQADRLRRALAPRIGCSIGVATTGDDIPHGVDSDTLMRVADRLMYAEKRGVAPAEADPALVTRETPDPQGEPPERPPVTYTDVLRRRKRSSNQATPTGLMWLFPLGYLVIAACGAAIAYVQLSYGGSSFWDQALRTFWIPWVALNVLAAVATAYWWQSGNTSGYRRVAYHAASFLVGVGIWCAMLAGSNAGIASPIMSGLILKVIFDAYTMRAGDARQTLGVIMFFWLLTVIFGPADVRWIAPFHVALFLSAHAVGLVARNAYADVTRSMLRLANADVLTGLRNRTGHEHALDKALDASRRTGAPLSVIALDLDDFKSINDTYGHEAGDDVLREVAAIAERELPDALSIARIGGDEFVAVLPIGDQVTVKHRCAGLVAALKPVVGASAGYAIFGDDAHERGSLMNVADRRSYEAKRLRREAANRNDAPGATPAAPQPA